SLTYGLETWILTEETRSRVQAAEMRFLRKVVGVTRRDRIRSSQIREELGVSPLILEFERGQLRWLGHVLRMPEDRIARRLLIAKPEGPSPVGRPRRRWLAQVKLICQRVAIDTTRLQDLAEDRGTW